MRPCLQVVILLQNGDAGLDCGHDDGTGDDDDDGGDDDGGGGDHDGDDGNNGKNSATSVRQRAEKLRLFCRQFKGGPICIYLKQSYHRQRCQNGNFR